MSAQSFCSPVEKVGGEGQQTKGDAANNNEVVAGWSLSCDHLSPCCQMNNIFLASVEKLHPSWVRTAKRITSTKSFMRRSFQNILHRHQYHLKSKSGFEMIDGNWRVEKWGVRLLVSELRLFLQVKSLSDLVRRGRGGDWGILFTGTPLSSLLYTVSVISYFLHQLRFSFFPLYLKSSMKSWNYNCDKVLEMVYLYQRFSI